MTSMDCPRLWRGAPVVRCKAQIHSWRRNSVLLLRSQVLGEIRRHVGLEKPSFTTMCHSVHTIVALLFCLHKLGR